MPRSLRILAPAVLVALTLTALLVALGIGGGAAERMLLDPGDLVRYGVPISRSLMNVGMAGMIGALAGVGFTVAMLLAELSFSQAADADTARLAVMAGSVLAVAVAALFLVRLGDK